PTFLYLAEISTGNRPYSVSIGDINGDGKPDLAVANFKSDTASILLNTTPTNATTPTFATKVDFTTGGLPRSVGIGDFNGDSKPDLAVANYFGNTASILLNTTATGATTPTFAPKVDFLTGSFPYSVSIGDINGDGKPDLAVANSFSNTASILLNTTATGATTPTLATKVDFLTGSFPQSVSIGDINGDSKPDLAVANFNGDTASILLNTTATGATTPTFATKVDFPTGNRPYSVSIGDINGDGKPDLAVANNGTDTASILLNTTPKVTAVTATTANGSYGVGSTINITVTFDAAVNVTGTPRLQLETGTTDQFATYASGSGGTVLTFNYVVQPGDTTPDLQYLATNALTLNGGTIQETAATAFDAFLTLPPLATANSLGGSKAIVIDTLAPTVALTSTSPTTTNAPFLVTATFSENVTGFSTTGVNVVNGTVSGFTGTGTTYSFTVTPTATGAVTVDIPAARTTDTAGNNNTAVAQLTRTNDDCIADQIAYPNLNKPNSVENTIFGVSNIQIGTAKNDEFLGSDNGNIFNAKLGDDNLYGGDGNDILNGNEGNDFIVGGKGNDLLFGGKGNDIILGGEGEDIIFGNKGNDSLNGCEENDQIYGNEGADFIDGGKGNDALLGGKGDDILDGDLGNDSLIGGSGNDIFVLKSGQGFDIIGDFTVGQDLIGLSGGLSFGQLGITQNTQGTLIKNVLTGEELGVMIGVSANVITSANFRLI
ncbi:FG-GAP-like repeat-containing protein, partial [Microcoleus sp.]|uniref:calcium-binding protein n=1 Tax=Microcoleus sp. TaxID=44472 RepID=UPI0035244828